MIFKLTPLIVLLTLFVNSGCQPNSSSLSEVKAITSTDISQYNDDIKSTIDDNETTLSCVKDNEQRIAMYFNENLDTIVLSGHGEFTLNKVEEIETARGRPLEFTRFYSNHLGESAVLTSQAASRYLELESKEGSKTSYQFTHGIECDEQNDPKLSSYIVNTKKAYLYKEPYWETKTASYFVQGDKVDTISLKEEWIKVSYVDNKKVGWLRSKDLIPDRDNTTNYSKDSSTTQNIDTHKGTSQVLLNASQSGITQLPITMYDYAGCNGDYCADKYPMHNIEDLPVNLIEEFDAVSEPETVLRLPNINDIEVYILARNYTDVEEYGIVTFKDHIIDSMLIGRVGTMDSGSDYNFSISDAYQKLEVTNTDLDTSKLYKINESGRINLIR